MIPFFDAYGAIVAWVFSGETELNERTGVRVKVGRGGTAFRVEVYRTDKSGGGDKDKFAGMIMVRFADPGGAAQARKSALPGIEGRESELGW